MVGTERRRSRFIGRAIIGLVALLIVWYLASRVFALFDHAIGKRAASVLSIRSGVESAQVSLQGGEWQRAESNLRLYPGDAIAARGDADIVITLFDGSNVRLEKGSEVMIERSDSYGDKAESSAELSVRTGRVWINTPTVLSYSGAITRTVVMPTYTATVPAHTNALLSASKVVVLRAAGIGLKISLTIPKNQPAELYVGEGQYLDLNEEARQAIETGTDPYDFREALTSTLLQDEFLSSSVALFNTKFQGEKEKLLPGALPTEETEDLVLTSPENHATVTSKTVTVSGRVSSRVALVLVNGQNVPVKDLKFSVDVSLSTEQTTTIRIEAQDLQGVSLAQIEQTLVNAYKVSVEPVRIKSPVGSGETLTTTLGEIEITGEAPQGTAGIMINDYRLQLFKPGTRTWSYLASTALHNLVPGTNIYTVYALDADGNRSPGRGITIILNETGASGTGTAVQPPIKQNNPLTPGVLAVDTPTAGLSAETSLREVVLAGRTSEDTYSISINGYTLSLYLPGKTTWNYIASVDLQTMKRGKNIYRIVARNKNGEILDLLEYIITFKP